MTSELPTKEELEQLYKDKGKEAVVWYAWRNVMRALPVFMCFGSDEVKRIVAYCKFHLFCATKPELLVSSYVNQSSSIQFFSATDATVYAKTADAISQVDHATYSVDSANKASSASDIGIEYAGYADYVTSDIGIEYYGVCADYVASDIGIEYASYADYVASDIGIEYYADSADYVASSIDIEYYIDSADCVASEINIESYVDYIAYINSNLREYYAPDAMNDAFDALNYVNFAASNIAAASSSKSTVFVAATYAATSAATAASAAESAASAVVVAIAAAAVVAGETDTYELTGEELGFSFTSGSAISAVRAYNTASAAACVAARADYNDLKNTNHSFRFPFYKSLWTENSGGIEEPPEAYDRYFMDLLQTLKHRGLNFLANDLKLLSEMHGKPQPIPKHWKNYAKKISDSEFNDPDALRTIILGESVDIKKVRVLFLGPDGSSKSTLVDHLLNKPVMTKKNAVQGIHFLENEPLDLSSGGAFAKQNIPENLELYCWDCGDQPLFYGMHKTYFQSDYSITYLHKTYLHGTYLHENCVYVLVIDAHNEQASDEWLHQIAHLSKNNRTAVLVVSNEYEGCHYSLNENRLKREFSEKLDLSFHYFSCNQSAIWLLNTFKQKLLNKAACSRYVISKQLLNTSDQVKQYGKNQPLFYENKFLNLLRDKGLLKADSNQQEEQLLLNKLKSLGLLVAIDQQGKRLCLDPAWLINHAYQLLSFKTLEQGQGLVDKIDLGAEAEEQDEALNNDLKANLEDLLCFLKSSKICVDINSQTPGNHLFFPDLAPINEPGNLPRKQDCITLSLHFPYLPIGLFARLVSHWMQSSKIRISDYKDVWRTGFILRYGEPANANQSGSGIWLEYLSRKAIIQLHGFGESTRIAKVFTHFWEELTSGEAMLIAPIKAGDILPLLSLNKSYFKDSLRGELEQASRWLKDPNILQAYEKIKESTNEQKTIINFGKDENTDDINIVTADGSKLIPIMSILKQISEI